MKAITTKYYGPTNTKGARITASDSDGNRATISYPYDLSGEACHRAAADQLCGKMGWSNDLIGGATKTGYVFVFRGQKHIFIYRASATGAWWLDVNGQQVATDWRTPMTWQAVQQATREAYPCADIVVDVLSRSEAV